MKKGNTKPAITDFERNLTRQVILTTAFGAASFSINIFYEGGPVTGVVDQFIKNHGANLFDPGAVGGILNSGYICNRGIRSDFGEESAVNRPETAVAVAFASGVGYEYYQSLQPKAHFDAVDCGVYLAGSLVFLALSRQLAKPFKPV